MVTYDLEWMEEYLKDRLRTLPDRTEQQRAIRVELSAALSALRTIRR